MAAKTAPKTVNLTPRQALFVKNTREALQASQADRDSDNYGSHLGALEYRLEAMLALVAELTGDKDMDDKLAPEVFAGGFQPAAPVELERGE